MSNPLNEKDYVTFARRFVKETVETLDYQELKNLVTDYIHEDLQRSMMIMDKYQYLKQ